MHPADARHVEVSKYESLSVEFFDMAGEKGEASEIANYIVDSTPATLMRFSLNVGSGVLKLTFDDVVNVTTLDAAGMSICPNKVNLASDCLALSEQTELTQNLENEPNKAFYVTALKLTSSNMNALKEQPGIATDVHNTYVSLQPYTFQDVQNQNIIGIPHESALKAADHTPDSVGLSPSTFELDMDEGTIFVEFPEAINPDKIDITRAYLVPQGGSTDLDNITEDGSEDGSGDSVSETFVRLSNPVKIEASEFSARHLYRLNDNDLNDIKTKSKELFAGSFSLKIYQGFAVDFKNNSVPDTVLTRDSHERDETNPKLVNFTLDMNTGTMTLTFDETVDHNSFVTNHIIIQDASTFTIEKVTLHDGTVIDYETEISKVDADVAASHRIEAVKHNPSSGPVITFSLSKEDLDIIKTKPSLATSEENSFLLIDGAVVKDMEGNNVTLINDGDALRIISGGFTQDTTHPKLKSFTVDLNPSLSLSLVFSEPVYAPKMDVTKITLQSHRANTAIGFSSYPVSAGSDVTDDFSTMVRVDFPSADVNAVKAMLDLFTNAHDSYLSITDGLVRDMNNNTLVPVNLADAMNASKVILDTTRPNFVSFDVDMNATWNRAVLTLRFDETVSAGSVDPKQLTLQNKDGSHFLQLTGGTCKSLDGTSIEITLSSEDLNRLKADRDLVTSTYRISSVATPGQESSETTETLTVTENTYLSGTDLLVKDTSNTSISNNFVFEFSAKKAKGYTEDKTAPRLDNFTLDMTINTLILTFSETVDLLTFNYTGVSVQASSSCSGNGNDPIYSLSYGSTPTVAPDADTEVSIKLSTEDAIGARRALVKEAIKENTFLALTPATVKT
jgi:hypothetical protein